MWALRNIVGSVCSGVCGSIIFAVINQQAQLLTGNSWFVAMGVAFVVFFGAAYWIFGRWLDNADTREESSDIATDLESKGKMDLEIEDVSLEGGGSKSIASRNKSEKDMKITAAQ